MYKKENMMRGVGRTQNLIDNLPSDRCMIVTPNHGISRIIKEKVEEVNGKEFAKRIKFLVVESRDDLQKMMGYSNLVFFDHSFFDLIEENIVKEALNYAHGAAIVFKVGKYK